MKIAIDATNIKAGGGLSHLKQICSELIDAKGVEIHIFGGTWLEEIKLENKHIYKKEFSSLVRQEIFKNIKLPKLLKKFDIVFAPGGTFHSKTIPYIPMSQNMLVFENKERNRFPISFTWLRYLILERIQLWSFRNAAGIIYISEYAKNYIENKYKDLKSKNSTVIYHGISDSFRQLPKEQFPIENYSSEKPFKLLYVSIVNYYKHQWNVIDAVKKLKENGFPIELELVGPMYKSLEEKVKNALKGAESYITYKGKVPYEEIASSYKNADLFIFASTCENMPNILIEAMSAGLPILCSNYGPMPEVLKDAGVFMDPTDMLSISTNLEKMLKDYNMRHEVAQKAYKYSQEFSWKKAAMETLEFIKETVQLQHS